MRGAQERPLPSRGLPSNLMGILAEVNLQPTAGVTLLARTVASLESGFPPLPRVFPRHPPTNKAQGSTIGNIFPFETVVHQI